MKTNFRFTLMTAAVLTIFMFSAFWTAPAFADDGTPPPTDAPAEANPPADGGNAAADSAPAESQPAAESAPVESQPAALPNLLEQLPENTGVILTDENGQTVPLATEEASQAVVAHDPMWCPAGATPGAATCSKSYSSLLNLVNDFSADGIIDKFGSGTFSPTGNGVIWIEVGNDNSTSEIMIDGSNLGGFGNILNSSLTLQGGWTGGTNTLVTGSTTFSYSINIVNWNGAVTINNLIFKDAVNTVYTGTGALNIDTSKNIALSNVIVNNTTTASANGAYLDNTDSTTQSTVTIKNSSFNDNAKDGIVVLSEGIVTFTNVSASKNGEMGANITNNLDLLASAVTINGSSFIDNGTKGLSIQTNGLVTLNQITANENTGQGVYVQNLSNSQAVKGTGFLTAMNNGEGVYIQSLGAITLANITTKFNSGAGVTLDNHTSVTPFAVTLSGLNIFNDNANIGLNIDTKGAVLLNNITAIGNGTAADSGVKINNEYNALIPQNVTFTGYNLFNNNGLNGLIIDTYGIVLMNNVTANNNGNDTHDDNGAGVRIENNGGSLSKSVTLKGSNTFNGNDQTGLIVFSNGVIAISNLSASDNGNGNHDGIGSDDNFTGDGAVLHNFTSSAASAVTLTGFSYFGENDGKGLDLDTNGAITLNNITAYNNESIGALLDNQASFQAAVSINGYGLFESNELDGLVVLSSGTITTNNLSAYNNYRNGATFETNGIVNHTITLKGNNNFSANGSIPYPNGAGLIVNSDGNILINNLTANYNGGTGADLDTYTLWSTGTFSTVTLTGYNTFIGSYNGDGLYVTSKGAVVLNNVTSAYNSVDGIQIDAYGNVTLTCSTSTYNTGTGLNMQVTSNILTLKGYISSSNGASDIWNYTTLPQPTRCP